MPPFCATTAHYAPVLHHAQDEDSDEDPRFKEVINAVLSSVSKLPGRPEVRGVCVASLASNFARPRSKCTLNFRFCPCR